MPEKEDKVKTSKKTSPKKTAGKTQSKTKSRTGTTTAKKKPRSSTARKKRSRGNIIAALVILCVLLLGFNLVLVLKLVPNLKNSLKQDTGTAQTQEQQDKTSTEQKRNEPLTAAQEPSPPVTVPQVAAQAQPHTDSAVQQKRQNTPATQQKTASSQEKAPTAKKTTPAAQPAPHSPAAASVPASHTASAAQKDTAKKEKSAVHAAPQKNTVPEKSVTPDKKNTSPEKNTVPAVPDKKNTAQAVQPIQPAAKPEKPRRLVPYAGNLTFVFDDAGHNLDQLEYFLRLPFPCTIAVLPGLRYSSESARRIRKAGKQVILHQPMQSVDLHINPGPGAVTPGLSAEQIKNIVRKNLEEIWPVAGMNNHEGSLMTADEAAMRAVLDVVAEKHIFFLDSRTTAKSVVPKVAKEKNMVVWERAIFIDNDKSRAAMETQIKKGLSIARQKGSAIMIGHVFTVELAQLLTEMYPALIEEGFSLSAIAQAAQKGHIE
ncbi:divergent polysaccharide deacetylase family protein [Treponema vincentii]|uniref:divergent polysaccharide deacetylase family protein n=1 Tax=Treponema vincentii TaxID=69710 RepID=UPI0035F56936